jgi:hypothetical protein
MFPNIERDLLLFKILQEKNIPRDIFSQVYQYIHKNYKLLKQQQMNTLCFYINVATSRKNGFDNQEIRDTEDPHWVFGVPDFSSTIITNGFSSDRAELQLQAVNCNHCGNYIHSSVMGLPSIILCDCHE